MSTPKRIKYKGTEYRLVESKKLNENRWDYDDAYENLDQIIDDIEYKYRKITDRDTKYVNYDKLLEQARNVESQIKDLKLEYDDAKEIIGEYEKYMPDLLKRVNNLFERHFTHPRTEEFFFTEYWDDFD